MFSIGFCCVVCGLLATVAVSEAQILPQNGMVRQRLSGLSPQKWKNRLTEKLMQYRLRNTKVVCYDSVGCFELPHKRSPLQKAPQSPEVIGTKFFLFRRNINFSEPEVIHFGDGGFSVQRTKFNASQPLKLVVHGYMSKWNEKGALLATEEYLKIYDCNVILMDWTNGAKGPNYAVAAANTELVGRQLGMLLVDLIDRGMSAKNIHLIGFSLGAHVAGTASEVVKMKGHLLGRITGLDAASPLFRSNHLREKNKKLDREDAELVDAIHTDASPDVTDGFGLWEPIGHVDFFPNGGQEQPGCKDTRRSIVVSHFETRGRLTRDIACSHIRAWHLFLETLKAKASKGNACEFVAYGCTGGLTSYEKGHCFPQLGQPNAIIGKPGEDVAGEGVMYFTTRDSSPFCGTQLQASVFISQKTEPIMGVLHLTIEHNNHTTNFKIKCEIMDIVMAGTEMNGLGVAEFNTLIPNLQKIRATLSYEDLRHEESHNETRIPVLYINKIVVRDMEGNSWYFCQKDTVLQDTSGIQHSSLSVELRRDKC